MEFISYAKWILCGEHAVVRGGKAIAFPLDCYKCSIFYEKADELIVEDDSEHRNTFISLLQSASAVTGVSFDKIRGKFTIKNNIPIKAGLGSSSAICRNVANIFMHLGFCSDVASLARCLEDVFHGESSGLDISVAMINRPIVFKNNRVVDVIDKPFLSRLMLTYSGKKAPTSRCAEVIKCIFSTDRDAATKLDMLMNHASDMCEQGVRNADFEKLKKGILLGNEVFHRWKLCDDNLLAHMNFLRSIGAVAAKPIGSGLGGYVVSLWEKTPKKYGDISLTFE